jgi:hypothetical protein
MDHCAALRLTASGAFSWRFHRFVQAYRLLVHMHVYDLDDGVNTFVKPIHNERECSMTSRTAIEQYIEASELMHELVMTAEQRRRVVDTFEMTAAMIAPLLDYRLPPEVEAAPVFRA